MENRQKCNLCKYSTSQPKLSCFNQNKDINNYGANSYKCKVVIYISNKDYQKIWRY